MGNLGNVRIADDVVKTVAAKAAADVEGVFKLSGGVADEFSKILGKKRPTHGIKVEVGDKECTIDIYIVVLYGYNIALVAENVQKAVLKDVNSLTGLNVVEVNIFIQNIKVLTDEEGNDDEENISPL